MMADGVRHWLSSLNLHEHYEELLLAAGYDTLEKCAQLNDALLEHIGIKPAGHRRRILLHLPRTVNSPSSPTPDYDSDDDREIYDIPPVARRPGVVPKRESVYTNFVEMNEIPKPVLPQKKRLPSDTEVGARLGIVSPPVKPHLPRSIFDASSSSTDSARASPKLCVVYPEKRPPVPTRRISKDGKAASATAENQLNNNVEGFKPGTVQKAPSTDAVAPVARPRTVLKPQNKLNEDDSKEDREPNTTAHGYDSPVHDICSLPVDPVAKSSLQIEDGSAGAFSEKRLNPDLEQELQEILSSAKKSVLRKVDLGTDIVSESCGNPTIAAFPVVQALDNATLVSSVPSNSSIYDKTAMVKKSLIFTVTDDLCSPEARVEESSFADTTGTECAYITGDPTTNIDHLHRNQELVVNDLHPVLQREEVEPSDELEYEIVDQIIPEEHCLHIRNSSECHYPPPDFPPPPLPTDFVPSTYSKSDAGNQMLPARTSMSGSANFVEDRAKVTGPVKPQPPPRRRQSADIVDDTLLSPTAAGFSSALDEYLTKKVTSPYTWLNQPAGYFDQISDVCDSGFGPFVDTQPREPLSEFTKHTSHTKQSVRQSDQMSHESVFYDVAEPVEASNYTSMSTKTKSSHSGAQSIVKPLTSEDDFKEDICYDRIGEWI